MLGEGEQRHNVVADSGSSIDDEEVVRRTRLGQSGDETLPLLGGERSQRLHAGRRRQDAHTAGPVEQGRRKRQLAGEHMADVRRGRESEHDVNAAQTEVTVNQRDAMAVA